MLAPFNLANINYLFNSKVLPRPLLILIALYNILCKLSPISSLGANLEASLGRDSNPLFISNIERDPMPLPSHITYKHHP